MGYRTRRQALILVRDLGLLALVAKERVTDIAIATTRSVLFTLIAQLMTRILTTRRSELDRGNSPMTNVRLIAK